jgi:hypothetical protein
MIDYVSFPHTPPKGWILFKDELDIELVIKKLRVLVNSNIKKYIRSSMLPDREKFLPKNINIYLTEYNEDEEDEEEEDEEKIFRQT